MRNGKIVSLPTGVLMIGLLKAQIKMAGMSERGARCPSLVLRSTPILLARPIPRESFTVVVHQEDEGFWGEVPELPGCASQGATLDELLANIIDAIQGCLEVHFEDEGPHLRRNVFTMNVPVSYPSKSISA